MTLNLTITQNCYLTGQAVNNAITYYNQSRPGLEIDGELVAKIVKEHEDLLTIHTNQPNEISEWYTEEGSLMVIEYLCEKLKNISEYTIETVVEGIEDYINRLV
jgi:hypothetical protein